MKTALLFGLVLVILASTINGQGHGGREGRERFTTLPTTQMSPPTPSQVPTTTHKPKSAAISSSISIPLLIPSMILLLLIPL